LCPYRGNRPRRRSRCWRTFPNRRRPSAGGRREHERAADVHQRAVVGLFELEECRIERCELVVGRHDLRVVSIAVGGIRPDTARLRR
jgi:hypothetical protein